MESPAAVKALLVCQNLNVGGAEELLLGASTHLASEGVQTGVVAVTRRGPIAQEIAQAGIPVHLAGGQPGPRDPSAFWRLVGLFRRERPDVVHTYLLNASLYGRLAAILARVPLIVAAEQNVYLAKRRRHALMERALAARTFRVVACCRAVGEFYADQTGVRPNKISVIYNAVRFAPRPTHDERAPALARLGLPRGALVLGTVGRLAEQKGHRILLRAVAELAPRFPRLVVAHAGQGPVEEDLRGLARDLGIGDRVHFLGVRRDRPTLYAAIDVFVMPSLWEGLSLALVEAMGAARPVVATRVGGNPEVVQDGQTGLLVPPDDPAALAQALASLLSDPASARALGEAASQDARARFSIQEHVSQVAALYRRGLAERRQDSEAALGAPATR